MVHGSPSSLPHQLHQNNHINQIILGNECSNREESRAALKLKLTITPTLINQVKEMVAHGSGRKGRPVPTPDPLKAANFPAQSIQIGRWKRKSKHEDDLVVKCYFKKRKLVWEALEGNLKYKVEFLWSNIMAIRAAFGDIHKPSTLDIMLEKPPVFFQEVNPQPRRHTNWQSTHDFTRGYATTMRRHTLKFAVGILERHYPKILQCDNSLLQLSQRPFPEGANPYFSELAFRDPFLGPVDDDAEGMYEQQQQQMPPPQIHRTQPAESSEPPCIYYGTMNPDCWLSTTSDYDNQRNTTMTFSRQNANNHANLPIQKNQYLQNTELIRLFRTELINSEPQESALPGQAVGGASNSSGGVNLDNVPEPNLTSPPVTAAKDTLIFTPLLIDLVGGNTNASSNPMEMPNGCALLNPSPNNSTNAEGRSASGENLTADGEAQNAEPLDWWMALIQDDDLMRMVMQETAESSFSPHDRLAVVSSNPSKGDFSSGRPP